METGSLAEVAVPGLHGLGRRGVLDDFVDASPNAFHLLEVDALGDEGEVFGREFGRVADGLRGRRRGH